MARLVQPDQRRGQHRPHRPGIDPAVGVAADRGVDRTMVEAGGASQAAQHVLEFAAALSPPVYRSGLRLWAWLAARPALYHALVEAKARLLGWLGRDRGRFRSLPLASGWTLVRDMPAPEGRSFHSLWAERQSKTAR